MLTKSLILAILLIGSSCSSDDDSGGTSGINIQNLVANFDENPTNGASVGTIQAASGNTLSFSITSQTPSGALSINPSTGELTVANAALFDFETNPVVNANISVIDPQNTATATATVNLNDLDDIESFLSTSKADYIAASDGNWVLITENEYNTLANSLNDITKVGTSDTQYNDATGGTNLSPWTILNDNGSEVPPESYVFAFKYFINNTVIDVTGFKVKQSETIDDNYSNLGNPLPMHSATSTSVYFALKGNSAQLMSQGYLGIFKPNGGIDLGFDRDNENYYFADNDVNTGFGFFTGYGRYQGLSTTQKQW